MLLIDKSKIKILYISVAHAVQRIHSTLNEFKKNQSTKSPVFSLHFTDENIERQIGSEVLLYNIVYPHICKFISAQTKQS